jgi:myo-inositol catabolism protein IolC
MRVYLIGVNPDFWKIVCVGVNILKEDEPITQEEFEI